MWVEEIESLGKPEYRKRRWKVEKKIKTHLLEEMETGNWNFWFQAVYGRCRMHTSTSGYRPTLFGYHYKVFIQIFVKNNDLVAFIKCKSLSPFRAYKI